MSDFASLSDTVSLIGLTGTGFHGVLPQERRDGQAFILDVHLHVDVRAAALSDDLTDTTDYSQVAADAMEIIEGEAVNLIETLADRIAVSALAHPGVLSVEVAVHKPQAPVGVAFEDVVVRIRRP